MGVRRPVNAWIVQFARGARPLLGYLHTPVLCGRRFRLVTMPSLPVAQQCTFVKSGVIAGRVVGAEKPLSGATCIGERWEMSACRGDVDPGGNDYSLLSNVIP